MRKNIVAGLILAVAAGLIVVISEGLDLDLESAALLGGALGAVVALVPDKSAGVRLGGFAAGFVIAWVSYALRAAVLPDSAGGRAAGVVIAVLLCVAIAGFSRGRVPLWAVLLGAGAFSGAYEFTYDQAPPELLSTSVTTATTLLFNVAVGFLAATLVGADRPEQSGVEPGRHAQPVEDDSASLNDFMKAGQQ